MSNEPLIGVFHDAETGETITRELTQEEINALPKDDGQIPTSDGPIPSA